jgi:glycosyltransferase involved in cell wall biosynthesis
VLFVDHTATWGGGEVALFNLVRAIDPARYRPVVLLFSDGPLGDKFRAAGIETRVLGLDSGVINARKDDLGGGTLLRVKDVASTLGFTGKLRRFMRQQDVALVHSNSLKSDLIGGFAARAARLPLIWHVRDRIADDYLPCKVAKAFRLMCRVVPTRVIAISEAVRQTLGSNPRVRVVHDGTPLPGEPASQTTNREGPLIGLVGRITPWKGQDVFLRAAAIVRRQFPNARFQVIGAALFGERDYEQRLHERVRTEGLSDAVEFTGFRTDVPDLIARLDVLVHASTTGEPFGQVVIEGMAAGKPVIATRGGAIPEIVVEGQTGVMVPMGDAAAMARAMVTLLSDPVYACQLGRAGRQRVTEQFTIGHTAAGVQAVYDEVLGSTGRNAVLK